MGKRKNSSIHYSLQHWMGVSEQLNTTGPGITG